MKLFAVVLCVLALVLVCPAQTATGATSTTATGAATAAAAPSSWFVGSGVEFNPYSSTFATPAYEPFVHVGACWTSFCEITTMEFGASSATVRQDVGYKLKASSDGSSMLIAVAGGSLTTTTVANTPIPTSINLGGVGGGFSVKFDPGLVPFLKAIKGKGVSILGEVRVNAISSQGVQPQLAVALNYRFR
jgi:hypothetical protein